MECSQCHTSNPDLAVYCLKCGHPLRERNHDAYAVQSSERTSHVSVLSTIMPHTDRHSREGYRWALAVAVAIIVGLTVLGYGAAALIAAACVVPIAYLLYLYDANVWRDTPLVATLLVIGFAAALSALISLVFFDWVFDSESARLSFSASGGFSVIPLVPLLLFAVVLPIIATLAMIVGPCIATRLPGLDDMIDGFTFGVGAGTAYAAIETIVAFAPAISGGRATGTVNTWLPVILNLMIVKSVLYGTGAGIVIAAFSGRGRGSAGVSSTFVSALGFVAVINVAYRLGSYLLDHVQGGRWLSVIWGGALMAFILFRARVTLHAAILQAALDDAQGGQGHPARAVEGATCIECGMPLLKDAMFCVVCGQSVRATARVRGRAAIDAGGAS